MDVGRCVAFFAVRAGVGIRAGARGGGGGGAGGFLRIGAARFGAARCGCFTVGLADALAFCNKTKEREWRGWRGSKGWKVTQIVLLARLESDANCAARVRTTPSPQSPLPPSILRPPFPCRLSFSPTRAHFPSTTSHLDGRDVPLLLEVELHNGIGGARGAQRDRRVHAERVDG
eukprot:scaffold181340_cov15-Tisochrysis_lutea.AAC.1